MNLFNKAVVFNKNYGMSREMTVLLSQASQLTLAHSMRDWLRIGKKLAKTCKEITAVGMSPTLWTSMLTSPMQYMEVVIDASAQGTVDAMKFVEENPLTKAVQTRHYSCGYCDWSGEISEGPGWVRCPGCGAL